MQKLLKILLVIFILCLAVNAIHAENNTASYSNLTDEINALDDNSTLNLISSYQFDNLTDSNEGVVISKNITIKGNDAYIDGNHQARGFLIESNCNVVIENLTFKNCFCNNNSGGCAILLSANSNLTLKNCIFQNNKAYNANGAALNCQESTNTDVYGCTFSDNACIRESDLEWEKFKRGMGSAICVGLDSNLKLHDSTFRSNSAYLSTIILISYTGDRRKTSTLYVNGCLFENNTSRTMSAIYLDEFGQCELLDSTFRNNVVTYFGGTVCLECCLPSTVRNCVFESNRVIRGGGLYIIPFEDNVCDVQISGCTFSKNAASEHGGAIYVNAARVAISGCTFQQNTASANGGALFTYQGSVQISSSRFISNRAKLGGGAYLLSDSITVRDVFFNGNSASDKYGGIYSKTSQVSVSNCGYSANSAPSYPNVYGAFFADAFETSSYFGDVELSVRLTSPWLKSSTQNIYLLFNGGAYKSKWLKAPSNGVLKYTVPFNLKCGSYSLKIMSNSGLCFSSQITVKVTKAPVKVLLKKSSVKFNSGKKLKFKIRNSKTKRAVPFAKVKLRVYTHRSYRNYRLKADKNGVITFSTLGLAVGKHTIKAFNGDKNIRLSKKAQSVIKVNKGSCKIIHPNKIKRHTNLKAKVLTTISKNPIRKAKFTVKVDYRYYKVKTNSKGILKIPSSKLGKGKHKVKVTLKNKNYKISKKFTFKIK